VDLTEELYESMIVGGEGTKNSLFVFASSLLLYWFSRHLFARAGYREIRKRKFVCILSFFFGKCLKVLAAFLAIA
jgi:hypothetical protein